MDIAILKHDNGTIRHIPDGSEEYFAMIDSGEWDIEDVIVAETPEADGACWADGSPITSKDIENRYEDAMVAINFHRITEALNSKNITWIEAWAMSGGARYIVVDNVKIRISNHVNCSARHDAPAFNVAAGGDSVETVLSWIEGI